MKKRYLFIVFLLMTIASCGSSKNISSVRKKQPNNSKIEQIVSRAKSYVGTPYKYGGVTKKGMDCSGLVYTAFAEKNISLPRTSSAMSTKGKAIKKASIKKGDLLFFKTNKSSRKINHVGIVSKVTGSSIYFIHSSSSKGVIESSLANVYWSKAFSFAKRIL